MAGRHFKLLFGAALLALMPLAAPAQDSRYVAFPWGKQTMIAGPGCLGYPEPWEGPWTACDDATHEAWLADVRRWRMERRIRVGHDDARYRDPATEWTQSSFMQPQAMMEDRFLYDPVSRRYTVDRYLDDVKTRFGGIDAVLLWPTYPNIGIDDRNQIDMLASMPGGLAGVKALVDDFHRHGVKVLFPFMMWDLGTRDAGAPWPETLTKVMAQIGADGMNGDTQDGVPLAFSTAADAIGHKLAFQPEGPPSDEALSWNLMSWGQYDFGFVPKVDRFRWLQTRHMVNISDRWNHSKTDDLQYAFFNGEGWESWENIWGIWNGITPRDGEATRRVASIERAIAPFLTSPDWEPFYPMRPFGVFASRWPLERCQEKCEAVFRPAPRPNKESGETVWTIVNRNSYDVEGPQLSVPATAGTRWFDLYHGVELTPRIEGGRAILSFALEANGFGAVIALPGAPDAKLAEFLSTMKRMTARPLASYDGEWKPLRQTMTPVAATKTYDAPPPGMVAIPAMRFDFKVHGVMVEGGNQAGVDVNYPWEDEPRRFHDHAMEIRRFFIDRTPVTNRQFKAFLDATHYHPADDANFLKDWKDGVYPQGWDEKPVTWVSLEDARAYAAWVGKRLPHEWEWQYAAQGTDGRAYPWGNDWRADAVPVAEDGRTLNAPDAVDAHPAGASPFGVADLVGNVWQWTDEFSDTHTRTAILRGGSHYRPQGSLWYFPQAHRNDQHAKLLLMTPSRDRSGTIGFRCVADAR